MLTRVCTQVHVAGRGVGSCGGEKKERASQKKSGTTSQEGPQYTKKKWHTEIDETKQCIQNENMYVQKRLLNYRGLILYIYSSTEPSRAAL